jgi:hypothetical protein
MVITHNEIGFVKICRTPLDGGSAHYTQSYLYNTQHTQDTDILVPGDIRTHNPSMRTAVNPRLGSAATGIVQHKSVKNA